MKKKINLIVEEADKNLRVDVFIHKREKNISRTRIKNLILDKKLKVNNKILVDPSRRLSINDIIDLIIPEPKKLLLNLININ